MGSFTSKSLTMMRGNVLLAGLMISLLALVVSCGGGGGGGETTVTVVPVGSATVNTVPLSGTVYDNQGTPVAGAVISVLSTLYSTQSGTDGSFTINVDAAPHTVIVSKDGLTDSYKNVDLTGATEGTTEPFLLTKEPSGVSGSPRSATSSHTIISNLVDGVSASVSLPTQTTGTYTIGSTSSSSAYVSLQFFDVHEPLPFELPEISNRDSSLNFSAVKQAPISVVSVKPALLTGLAPVATISLPNPTTQTPRILHFDSETHEWIDAVTGGLLANATGPTSFTITEGGIYGIFQESIGSIGSISGTISALAGSQVFVGDQVITTSVDNENIYLQNVHVPDDGNPLQITIVDSSTTPATVSKTTVITVGYGTATIKQPGEPENLSLSLSQTTVKTDNSDSSTITATVLDSANVGVTGATVSFSSTGGKMSASSTETDANGEASIKFSSGTNERKNQIVTITAQVGSLPAKSIPVQVVGTTVSLSSLNNTNLEVGDIDTLVVLVKDASGQEINGADVTITTSNGSVALSSVSGTTGVTGTFSFDVTGVSTGTVDVVVSSLGATTTQSYTVSTLGQAFEITSLTEGGITTTATDPYSLATDTDLTITVQAPGMANVTFISSVGAWDGGASKVVTKGVSGGVASAVLKSSVAGIATIQVIDTADSKVSDSMKVAISASASDASYLLLQGTAANVAPNVGDMQNTVEFTASVRTADGQVVGNAPVIFYIDQPVGGGEFVFPVIALTDDTGVARTTFTSGSQSSGASGIDIVAEVMDSAPVIKGSANIIIGGTAGSIVIGKSTKIEEYNSNTYKFPVSMLVTDSNGNAVPDTMISVSVWPVQYNTGYWVKDANDECIVVGFQQYDNEDVNQNLILDPGEDNGSNPGHGDGMLTPLNSSAGTVPPTATLKTDSEGLVNFEYTYLKNYSVWITAEMRATTEVQGTESTSSLKFTLPYMLGDECLLSSSPFNATLPVNSMTVTASPSTLPADGVSQSTIQIVAKDIEGSPVVAGTTLAVAVTNGTGTLLQSSVSTNNEGVAEVKYVASTSAGTETITVTSESAVSVTVDIELDAETVASIAATSVSPLSGTTLASGVDTIQITYTVMNNGSPAAPVANQTVNFSAVGSMGGSPTISPTSAVTDVNGEVTVTITDTTSETVTITATTVDKTGSKLVTFTPLPASNIMLESTDPSPAIISIAGVGQQETATLTFKVVDTNNNPVQGSHLVDFSILNGGLNGGESLSIDQASTSNSLVSTIIKAGYFSGTVQIRASLNNDPTILTDVSVSVSGGLPAGNSLGLSPDQLNIQGRRTSGLRQNVTVQTTDFYSNPIADNVQVSFQTDYAGVSDPDVFVTDSNNNSSTALGTVTTGSPEPEDGFVTMAAQTIGGVHSKVLSLAVHPDSPNVIYAGTDGGGIFKTTDGGTTWDHVGAPLKENDSEKVPNLTGGMVRDIIIDSNNPSVVYAATEKGVYVSVNDGNNWNNITELRRETGDTLGILESDVCYGATGLLQKNASGIGMYVMLNGDDGVTTTSSTTFTSSAATFISTAVQVGDILRIADMLMVPDPGDGSTSTGTSTFTSATAAFDTSSVIAGDLLIIGTGADAGTYAIASVDSATTLTITGLTANATASGLAFIVVRVGGNYSISSVVSETALSIPTMPGTASGLEYEIIRNSTFLPFNFQHTGVRSRTTVYADGLPVSNYVMSGNGIFFFGTPTQPTACTSAAGIAGTTITADYDVSGNLPAKPLFAVGINKNSFDMNLGYAREIYIGTYGDGVYKTEDGGRNWFKASTMALGQQIPFGKNVLELHVNSADPTEVFAGTDGGGLFRSRDSGITWRKIVGSQAQMLNEIEVRSVIVEPKAGGADKIWVGGRNGIHYSVDGGANWSKPTDGTATGTFTVGTSTVTDTFNTDIRKLVRDNSVDGTLYAIAYGDVLNNSAPHGGVYKSTDGGETWTKLTDVSSSTGAHALNALALVGAVGSDTLIVGSEGRNISKSSDSGAIWGGINGSGSTSLTNTLFTTIRLMHSGSTAITVLPYSATYQPMDDASIAGPGYGSFGTIYNGEVHSFYIGISDDLGHRLTPGTGITISVSEGKLGGTSSTTLGDTLYGGTGYLVSWTNDSKSVDPVTATMTISVSSDNGSESVSLSRFLVGKLTGTPDPLELKMGIGDKSVSGAVQGSGGSAQSYTYSAISGTINAGTGSYIYSVPAGATAGAQYADVISITDDITGQSVKVDVSIAVAEEVAAAAP